MILLTGIPRSGTTLCCALLNKRDDVVALHEPIPPHLFPSSCTPQQALTLVRQQLDFYVEAIASGHPFEHGHKGGLQLDNPVGQEMASGVRKVVAERGLVQLPVREKGSYQLVVKHNALFTALLPELSMQQRVVGIVRNPVDVLLSWLTVDLPVNKGRLPMGERFSCELAQTLRNIDTRIERQWRIYMWFVGQFLRANIAVIRYEDVVATGGNCLDSALQLPPIAREPLSSLEREFPPLILAELARLLPTLRNADYGRLYQTADIDERWESVAKTYR